MKASSYTAFLHDVPVWRTGWPGWQGPMITTSLSFPPGSYSDRQYHTELFVVSVRVLVPADLAGILAWPCIGCVTLGRSFTLSEPLVPHL